MDHSVPQTDEEVPPEQRPSAVVMTAILVGAVLAAAVLLIAAWKLAHRPAAERAAAEGVDLVSAGYELFATGAQPWLVQWAAVVVLVAAAGVACLRVNWGAVILAAGFTLVVATIWWLGLCETYWQIEPAAASYEQLSWTAAQEPGGQSPVEMILLEFIGPFTCPLKLQGSHTLQGWDFLWTGLSTALVMATLTWVVRRTEADLDTSKKFNTRQFLLIVGWVLLYLSPVIIRAILRATAAA